MVWKLPYLFQEAMKDMIAEEEELARAPQIVVVTHEVQQRRKAEKRERRKAARAYNRKKKAQNNVDDFFNKDWTQNGHGTDTELRRNGTETERTRNWLLTWLEMKYTSPRFMMNTKKKSIQGFSGKGFFLLILI